MGTEVGGLGADRVAHVPPGQVLLVQPAATQRDVCSCMGKERLAFQKEDVSSSKALMT
jgi:hypothetical protein